MIDRYVLALKPDGINPQPMPPTLTSTIDVVMSNTACTRADGTVNPYQSVPPEILMDTRVDIPNNPFFCWVMIRQQETQVMLIEEANIKRYAGQSLETVFASLQEDWEVLAPEFGTTEPRVEILDTLDFTDVPFLARRFRSNYYSILESHTPFTPAWLNLMDKNGWNIDMITEIQAYMASAGPDNPVAVMERVWRHGVCFYSIPAIQALV